MKPLVITLGAGCYSALRWEGPRVEITVYAPGGRVVRRLRGDWNLTALRRADSEIRHVVGLAVRSGRAPAFEPGASR